MNVTLDIVGFPPRQLLQNRDRSVVVSGKLQREAADPLVRFEHAWSQAGRALEVSVGAVNLSHER